jgi:hypothetical protein
MPSAIQLKPVSASASILLYTIVYMLAFAVLSMVAAAAMYVVGGIVLAAFEAILSWSA